tara:strand:- start:10287 stop:10547 length:261 start_codon:yes stop_codon:yes gene_type:complete
LKEIDDEAQQVHGKTDHRDIEKASGRTVCGRSLPEAWHLGRDVLQVAFEVWQHDQQSEYTLTALPNCPTMWDHLNGRVYAERDARN